MRSEGIKLGGEVMKKKIIIIAAVAVALIVGVIIAVSVIGKKEEESYPKIAYINNISYYGTGERCEMVPRKMPDGVIETTIESEIMPDMMNSANFGSEYGSMEFMFLDDGRVIIHMGEDWYYFEQQ